MALRRRTALIWSFRPLAVFWAAVAVLIAAGALTLELLGPPGQSGAKSTSSAPAPQPDPAAQPAPSPPPALAQRPPAPPAPAPASETEPQPLGPAPLPALSAGAIRGPDPALLEPSPGQPSLMLPRIANGRAPEHAYAAAFGAAERHPRIALVIDGIGLNRALSEHAMKILPAAIDFSFSFYAPEEAARALASAGRAKGRECLVSVPMEPAGYPLAEEGRGALLTGADQDQNHRRLETALAHVPGCAGATAASDGMAGERFAAMHEAYGDVLEEIAARGLLYLDPRPGAPPPPGAHPPRNVDIVIDEANNPSSPATAEAIDERLAALERLAGEQGHAIGLAGPPRPLLIERLAVWANGLAAHGLVLAPLTAIRPPDPAPPQAR